ncbi:hypothetical protein KO507_00260 [Gilvimarinus agarilyticus]|uniref:hypothetical protein n=1 Tax=unclassified Gilvimarinus TaxID=2642066 RepID=UPI001C087F08|nr:MULTISPECIES: hypothetical protein [unclassified Gilvimarinus]MBU2884188.1 hypothetical protein [Gilvimarinus agarilyticus]MDO6569327.1 hypothetical protein [Gilvimarinus sp. 2_MG-2023]MDO6747481.1 hypothetical protein [Gilvimarinus sp. 1_MG-2023]
MVKWFCLLCLNAVLNACVFYPPPTDNANNESFISVVARGVQIHSTDAIAWGAPLEILASKPSEITTEEIEHWQQLLLSALEADGLMIAEEESRARYLIRGALVLDSQLSKAQMITRFGVAPALANATQLSDKTLIIWLDNAYTQHSVWRGAMTLNKSITLTLPLKLQSLDQAARIFSHNIAQLQ